MKRLFARTTPARMADLTAGFSGAAKCGKSHFDYRAWIIDLDGTLYRAFWVRAAMASRLLGAAPSTVRLLREFRRQQELLRHASWECDDVFRAQVTCTADRLQIPVDEVAQMVQDWMFDRPARWLRRFRRTRLLDYVAEFRRRGGRTAVISDYPARQKLVALGAGELFDIVIACGEPSGPRRLKPAPDGLLLAADRLGVGARDALVVGDRIDVDGRAAQRAEMDFCHVRHLSYHVD